MAYNLIETLRSTETSGARTDDEDVDVDFLAIGLADLPLVTGSHCVRCVKWYRQWAKGVVERKMGGKGKRREVAGGGQSVNLQQRSGKSRPGSRR